MKSINIFAIYRYSSSNNDIIERESFSSTLDFYRWMQFNSYRIANGTTYKHVEIELELDEVEQQDDFWDKWIMAEWEESKKYSISRSFLER